MLNVTALRVMILSITKELIKLVGATTISIMTLSIMTNTMSKSQIINQFNCHWSKLALISCKE